MDFDKIFLEIDAELKNTVNTGKIATYIPELSKVDAKKMGVHLTSIQNRHYSYGDSVEKFSVQSIAKVFALTLAYSIEDENLWERVGVEPSGTAFNSLVQLEKDNGIPRNPFINAGALVICDILISKLHEPKEELIAFIRKVAANPAISYNSKIANSEESNGYRNAALVNLMKDFGNIQNEINIVLDFYFNLCSIEMTTQELSRSFLFLASQGKDPISNLTIISESKSKRLNAIMQLCGFYDEAGEFSFKVGLPGKSGVGGGIIAVHPGKYTIAVWSPKLNNKGNSYHGMKFLELFTTKTQCSIF
jgi:glutaminase